MQLYMKSALILILFLVSFFSFSLTLEDRENACNSGDFTQCIILGYGYYTTIITDNRFYKSTKKKCNEGLNDKCKELEKMKLDAKNIIIDYSKALEFYEKSCKGGISGGCVMTGYMYYLGEGVSANYQKGFNLFSKECFNNNVIKACLLTIQAYKSGLGVQRDTQKAHKLRVTVCNLGHSDSCATLGVMHQYGRPQYIKKDINLAVKYYIKACNSRHALSCFQLGMIYTNKNNSLIVDQIKADTYFQKGCDLGSKSSCSELKTSSNI